MLSKQSHYGNERGQVVVLFALLVPVILTIGSIVVSAGNWYVLKRHLQTQVDAAALAGGQGFLGCGQDPAAANANVNTAALKFSGDTLRSRDVPLGPLTTPYNLQLEDSGDQRVVLNSTTYWPSGPGGTATDGAGYDYSDVSAAADAPKLGEPGSPCYNGYLDVKATDNKAPLLFRWIPLFPSPKSRARVELRELQGGEGLRPIGVPEVDPKVVAVLIVNENGPGVNDPASIVNPPDQRILQEVTPVPAGLEGMHVYRNTNPFNPVDLGGGSQDFRAVVVTSLDANFNATGSLSSICTGNPTQTFCYDYDGSLKGGISFIHSYNGGGSPPAIKDVTLSGGCGASDTPALPSNPYFNVDDGTTCGAVLIDAKIDFGAVANPVADPTCARVTYSAGSSSGPMTWNSTTSTWQASFLPAVGSGRNEVRLTVRVKDANSTRTNCSQLQTALSNVLVGAPYVGDDKSGPVQYLTIQDSSIAGGGVPANSINKTTSASLTVTVGFTPLLQEAAWDDDPIPLRIWNTPSQSRTLDCANGANGWNTAMQFGCPPYQIYNQAWHPSGCDDPPTGPVDPPDCIAAQNGNFTQSDATNLWASPCSATPNNWYTSINNGLPPPPNDPRWIPLFIVDQKAFLKQGKKYYPVRRFGGFYVTAGNGMDCQYDDPKPLPASTKRTIWGHFVTYLPQTGGEVIPAAELCSFTEGGVCVPVLVE